jgi:hypothetical protein
MATRSAKGAILGISGRRFGFIVQQVIDATGWNRGACEDFVLRNYKEIKALCMLSKGCATKADVISELTLLAQELVQERAKAKQHQFDVQWANIQRVKQEPGS